MYKKIMLISCFLLSTNVFSSGNYYTKIHANTGKCGAIVNQSADFSAHIINDTGQYKKYTIFYNICVRDYYTCESRMYNFSLENGQTFDKTISFSGDLKFEEYSGANFVYSDITEMDNNGKITLLIEDRKIIDCN